MNIHSIKELLSSKKKIVIISHLNPDGDAIGTSLAMYKYLINKGCQVDVMVPNNFPGFLKWMANSEKINVFYKNANECIKMIRKADIIFCLDFNSLNRIDRIAEYVIESKAIKVNIDHHLFPENAFDFVYSFTKSSSAAEVLYDFICELDDEKYIDKDVAEGIYVGIVTDTGSFSYSCNTPKPYLLCAKMIGYGIDAEEIHHQIYDTYSEDRLRLLGYCISQKLVVLNEYNAAYIVLTRAELEKFNFKPGDSEGIVNYPLSIENINIAALITEREEKIKFSLRSKGDLSVEEIARNHFGGGGHKNASGGELSKTSIEQAEEKFIEILKNFSNKS